VQRDVDKCEMWARSAWEGNQTVRNRYSVGCLIVGSAAVINFANSTPASVYSHVAQMLLQNKAPLWIEIGL